MNVQIHHVAEHIHQSPPARKVREVINLFNCTAMNVQIQSVKFDADKKLIEFVENKMSKLERFADRATGAEVILKLDKDFEKGNKVATITLHMPGDEDMVAEHRARAFEEAIDEAIDALKRQIEKFKEKVK